MEYLVVAVVCFILGMIYGGYSQNKLDDQIMDNLKQGKRVIIVVDEDATIFEMYGNRIRITKALTTFQEDPYDDRELAPFDLVSGVANKPLDNNEISISDEKRD
jgi:hypothetical protein